MCHRRPSFRRPSQHDGRAGGRASGPWEPAGQGRRPSADDHAPAVIRRSDRAEPVSPDTARNKDASRTPPQRVAALQHAGFTKLLDTALSLSHLGVPRFVEHAADGPQDEPGAELPPCHALLRLVGTRELVCLHQVGGHPPSKIAASTSRATIRFVRVGMVIIPQPREQRPCRRRPRRRLRRELDEAEGGGLRHLAKLSPRGSADPAPRTAGAIEAAVWETVFGEHVNVACP